MQTPYLIEALNSLDTYQYLSDDKNICHVEKEKFTEDENVEVKNEENENVYDADENLNEDGNMNNAEDEKGKDDGEDNNSECENKNAPGDENVEFDKVTKDEWKRNGRSPAIKVVLHKVPPGGAGMIRAPKGEVYISGANNLQDTEVFISNPDIYTQQIRSLLSRIDTNPTEKNDQDVSENKTASGNNLVSEQSMSQHNLRKRPGRALNNQLMGEDSDQGYNRRSRNDPEYEPSGTGSDSDQDNIRKNQPKERLAKLFKSRKIDLEKGQESKRYHRPKLASLPKKETKTKIQVKPLKKKSNRKLQIKLPFVRMMRDADEEGGAGLKCGRRVRRRHANPAATWNNSEPDMNENNDLLKGQGCHRKGGQSFIKKLPIPKYRFEGDQRIDLINFAMKHGPAEAAVHFSNALGIRVCETTIRLIVKKHLKESGQNVSLSSVLPHTRPATYNKFSPTEKRQMAKYCMKHGPSQTAVHLSKLWGVRVSPKSIHAIVRQYKKSLADDKGLNKIKYPNKESCLQVKRGFEEE